MKQDLRVLAGRNADGTIEHYFRFDLVGMYRHVHVYDNTIGLLDCETRVSPTQARANVLLAAVHYAALSIGGPTEQTFAMHRYLAAAFNAEVQHYTGSRP